MKIDLHTHILPPKWPDLREKFGYGDWIRLEHLDPCTARMIQGTKNFREIKHNCWHPLARLEDCEKAGVTTQVLSTVPVMFSYWAKPEHALELARILNDHIAEVCRQYPGCLPHAWGPAYHRAPWTPLPTGIGCTSRTVGTTEQPTPPGWNRASGPCRWEVEIDGKERSHSDFQDHGHGRRCHPGSSSGPGAGQ